MLHFDPMDGSMGPIRTWAEAVRVDKQLVKGICVNLVILWTWVPYEDHLVLMAS